MRHLVFLTASLLTLGSITAKASDSASDRALVPGEPLAATVGASPLIAVGRMVSSYDTTMIDDHGPRSFSITTFEPTSWLRGHAPGKQFQFVLWHPERVLVTTDVRPGERGPSHDLRPYRTVLICFQDLDGWGRVDRKTMLGAAQRVSRWAAGESSSPHRTARLTDWSDGYERQVRAEIARQAPEAMAARAERIVLARAPNFATTGTRVWTVERTLKGRAERRMRFRMVLPTVGMDTGGRAILLARRRGDVYEPVRVGGGIVAVKGDRVPAWDCSLAEAITRISP